jgi:hypothetical protein
MTDEQHEKSLMGKLKKGSSVHKKGSANKITETIGADLKNKF